MPKDLIVVDYETTEPHQVLAPIEALFEKGLTPGATLQEGASNAPLDCDTLAKVLSSKMKRGQALSIADTVVNTEGTTVTYFLGPASPSNDQMVTDYYIVKVHVCSDACKASNVMKDYLASHQNFDVDDDRLNLKPVNNDEDARLGDFALRSASTIFWIRGESVFVSVSHQVDAVDNNNPSACKCLSTCPQDAIASGGGPSNDAMVTQIARLLDQHLVTFWVTDLKQQIRPRPGITSSAPIIAKMGETFTVQLTNLTGVHTLKTAEVGDSKVAVLIEQGDASGKFVFIAMQPGETTLTLRVADAKTLAIAEVPAKVKVGAPTSG
ncbi:hypothetical protein GQ44DRAFT_765609 [Phaeosphaeriaceae sp. PMI808]|nr:hypothetical protein GQ44DRAFT_765609 [Phaeosphaeriaceae sp. PMI808]